MTKTVFFKTKPAIVRRKNGYVEFYVGDGVLWGYDMQEAEIATRRGLIRTIRHLCDKNWIKNAHIRQLIDISFEVAKRENV